MMPLLAREWILMLANFATNYLLPYKCARFYVDKTFLQNKNHNTFSKDVFMIYLFFSLPCTKNIMECIHLKHAKYYSNQSMIEIYPYKSISLQNFNNRVPYEIL